MQWTHSNASEVCLVIARLPRSSAIDQDSKCQRCPRGGAFRARSLVVGARAPQRCQGLRRRRRRGEVAVPRGNGQGCARSASFSRGGWSWSVPGTEQLAEPDFEGGVLATPKVTLRDVGDGFGNCDESALHLALSVPRPDLLHNCHTIARVALRLDSTNGSAEDVLDHYGAHRIALGGHPGGVRRQVASTFSLLLRI